MKNENNTPNSTPNSTPNNKHCFYHEVHTGDYDCGYCGEHHECLAKECCYAFNELSKTYEETHEKVKRILKNFQEGWDKENGNVKLFESVRSEVFDEFEDVVALLIDEDKKEIYRHFVENVLLRMSFKELNWLHYHYVDTKFFTTLHGMTLHQMYRFLCELDTITDIDDVILEEKNNSNCE